MRRDRWTAWAAVALVAVVLGGCTAVSDMFGEEEPEQTRVETPPEAQGDQPFPNLGTVPDEPPETSSAAERAEISEGLAADRENAEYTDESLGAQATKAPPAAPPAPAEPPAEPVAPPPPAQVKSPAIESEPVPPPASQVAPTEPAPAPAAPQAVAPQPAAPQPAEPKPAAPAPAVQAAQAPAPRAAPAPQPTPAPPPAAPPQPRVLEGGSVIVNPDAVDGRAAPGANPLLPSGESRPVALVFFRHGSASLSRNDIEVLREVVKLHAERGGLVRVIGHASMSGASGNDARQNLANFNISLARANAVARELSRLGVATDQIQVAAAGAQQPLYYETQATGEAGNRRVEIYLDY